MPESDPQYDRIFRRPTSRKIEYLSNRVKDFVTLPQELSGFPRTPEVASELLEHRNLVVHGRVYAMLGAGSIRKSGRRDVAEEVATSAEL